MKKNDIKNAEAIGTYIKPKWRGYAYSYGFYRAPLNLVLLDHENKSVILDRRVITCFFNRILKIPYSNIREIRLVLFRYSRKKFYPNGGLIIITNTGIKYKQDLVMNAFSVAERIANEVSKLGLSQPKIYDVINEIWIDNDELRYLYLSWTNEKGLPMPIKPGTGDIFNKYRDIKRSKER